MSSSSSPSAPVSSEVGAFHVRVCFMDQYLAVSINGKWVYVYGFNYVEHNTPVGIKLKAVGGDLTVSDIRSVELHDKRTAVYVDYEATADNALSSVIQQRPIEVYPETGREASFTYRVVRDELTPLRLHRYTRRVSDPSGASSDALVYYENVSISINTLTAKEIGLITRLLRLSDLETGAISASRKIQLTSIEKRDQIEADIRFDPRLQHNDKLTIDVVATGTGRHIQDSMVVEDISMSMEEGKNSMHVTGRRFKG